MRLNNTFIALPLDVTIELDDNLREIPSNPTQLNQTLAEFEQAFQSEQDLWMQMKIAQQLVPLYRIMGELDKAEYYANYALNASNQLREPQAQLMNLTNLALVYQYQGKYTLADRIFEQILSTCHAHAENQSSFQASQFSVPLHEIYDYLGTSKFHQGDYSKAIDCFQKSLEISGIGKYPQFIGNSQKALELAQQRMN